MKDGHKRASNDWKPSKTLDTDVVGTIQALAGTLIFLLLLSLVL